MRPPNRFAQWFPWPFVAIAVLLIVLIVATPILTGQPVGGIFYTQAYLVVDGLPGNDSTHFYVRGLSTTARYSEINLGLAWGFNWTGSFPSGPLNWTDWTNATSVLSIDRLASEDPVAVNVTALYTANGVNALYVGVLAVDVSIPSGSTIAVFSIVSDTTGINPYSNTVTNLPYSIPLVYAGTGGTS
ncbi:MAG: hypothetical protein L3J68_01445 [Thermoplasmata archaeon]|nr:hypothetical protein [Thermoplasmata archaeon]